MNEGLGSGVDVEPQKHLYLRMSEWYSGVTQRAYQQFQNLRRPSLLRKTRTQQTSGIGER